LPFLREREGNQEALATCAAVLVRFGLSSVVKGSSTVVMVVETSLMRVSSAALEVPAVVVDSGSKSTDDMFDASGSDVL
jgi:hypothetical protein